MFRSIAAVLAILGAAFTFTYFSTCIDVVHPASAIRFDACDDTAGILVILSDGSTGWYRPPFKDLSLDAVPQDQLFTISHCPAATTL